MLIGRDNEKRILQNALADEYSQFIAVYSGRKLSSKPTKRGVYIQQGRKVIVR